jgi:L-seryl-tRNA(Ser) seleniumtransferase
VPLLSRLTGAQAAVAVHSYSGALWLTLSALAADREVVIARAEVGDLGRNDSLPKLAAAAKAFLREVGATNRALAADYESAITPRTAALLKLAPDEYRIVGETATAELDELVPLARDRELVLIDALGTAPLVEPPTTIGCPPRSARAALSAGVDLAVLRGDGLVGGPACGILIGNREVVRRVSQHPLFAAWALDTPRSAALTATLECYENSERIADTLPLWQILTTPIENLRNRAERIAPQLAQVSGVASAIPVETRSPISPSLSPGSECVSYGVALAAADGDIHSLDKRLRSLPLPILGRLDGDRLILDLRTVLPRHDRMLIDALLGAPTADTQPQTGESK